jgi:hypothetical protein
LLNFAVRSSLAPPGDRAAQRQLVAPDAARQ